MALMDAAPISTAAVASGRPREDAEAAPWHGSRRAGATLLVLHQKVNKSPHSLAGGLESPVAGERQTPHGGSDRLDRKSAVSRAWRDYEVEDIRQTTRRLALAQTLAATNRRWPSQRAGISYRPARLAGHAAVGPAVKHPLMIGARPGRANGHHRCLSIVNRPFRALGGITRIFVKQPDVALVSGVVGGFQTGVLSELAAEWALSPILSPLVDGWLRETLP